MVQIGAIVAYLHYTCDYRSNRGRLSCACTILVSWLATLQLYDTCGILVPCFTSRSAAIVRCLYDPGQNHTTRYALFMSSIHYYHYVNMAHKSIPTGRLYHTCTVPVLPVTSKPPIPSRRHDQRDSGSVTPLCDPLSFAPFSGVGPSLPPQLPYVRVPQERNVYPPHAPHTRSHTRKSAPFGALLASLSPFLPYTLKSGPLPAGSYHTLCRAQGS